MDIFCLGVDSLIVSALYYFLKNKLKTLSDVQKASELQFDVAGSKEPPDVIEYGMVVGEVKPEGSSLKSNYQKSYSGVLQVIETREHISNFKDRVNSDTTRLISRIINCEKFKILRKNLEIKCAKPLDATYLFEDLHCTHTAFETNKESIASKVVTAIIAKERIKGVETTEKMLLDNSELTCFGRFEKISSSKSWIPGQGSKLQYNLVDPKKDYTFIITTLSKQALIQRLKSTTKALRISMIIFGTIGIGLGIYVAYNYSKSYIEEKRREWRLEEARKRRIEERRARAQHYDNETGNTTRPPAESTESVCVICLVNPREIILLDCGHVCLCTECLERLPTHCCPICRENYRSFAPCFIP